MCAKDVPSAHTPMGSIAMSVERLQWLLARTASGEDPDMVLMEEIANSEKTDLRAWADRHEDKTD